jgi:hypothetical protein
VSNNADDAGVAHFYKAHFPSLKELHIGFFYFSSGDNNLRGGTEIITKGNFNLKWVSFNPISGKQVMLSFFTCLKIFTSDWSRVTCIYLRKG